MKNLYLLLLSILILSTHLYAQKSSPHLDGVVDISRADGLIRCQWTISGLPDLGKQYRILLYRGFNIRLIKSDSGKVLEYDGFYNSKLNGEAAAYVLEKGNDTLALPGTFSLSCTGAFPDFSDTLNSFDFKGLIGFNKTALRATEQSKWYPVIYDVVNDRKFDNVTYNIRVNCPDCKMIYLNGDQAQSGPVAQLRSATARPLVLFCGDYQKQEFAASTFLNAGLSTGEAGAFNNNIAHIAAYYANWLGVPYGEKLTFLQHKAFEPFTPQRSWGFVVFPTIAVAGQGFKSEINVKTGRFRDTTSYSFYAHEMGHYYFGQLINPNGTLKWFFLESMAEFISIKATEAVYGKDYIIWFIKRANAGFRNVSLIPLSLLADPEKVFENYRYVYGPLLLLAMEKQFGPEKIRAFCRAALKQTGVTDYVFLVNAVKSAGIDEAAWKKFEMNFIAQTNSNAVLDYVSGWK